MTEPETDSWPSFAAHPLPPGRDVVAWGGTLAPASVWAAYREGVFPWFSEGDPVLWWSPDPRGVLPLEGLQVSRRLARTLRTAALRIEPHGDVARVMHACNEGRPDGQWIHPPMVDAYVGLAEAGHVHALEVWRGEVLVGGIYGVSVGGLFCAESMFHRERDMSKVALVRLVEHLRAQGFGLIDVQFVTGHLARMGCVEVPRAAYLSRVRALRDADVTY